MNYKSLAIKLSIVIVGLAATFAAGRYSASTPTVSTHTDTTDNKTVNDAKNTDTTTKTVIVKDPTSGKETTTIISDTKTIDKSATTDISQSKTDSSVQGQKKNTLTVSALVGLQTTSFSQGNVVYGASVTKDIVGPVSIGLFGLSNNTFGASVGLSF